MNNNFELNGNMSILDIIITMSKSNPGAMMAITHIINTPEGFKSLFICDKLNIKGDKLNKLFNDCCDSDISNYLLTMQLFSLGYLTNKQILVNLSNFKVIPFIENINFQDYESKSTEEKKLILKEQANKFLEKFNKINQKHI